MSAVPDPTTLAMVIEHEPQTWQATLQEQYPGLQFALWNVAIGFPDEAEDSRR